MSTKYEGAAKEYAKKHSTPSWRKVSEQDFLAGAEHASKEAQSEGTYKEQQIERLAEIESVIKASHNAAINKAIFTVNDIGPSLCEYIVEELEKLKL